MGVSAEPRPAAGLTPKHRNGEAFMDPNQHDPSRRAVMAASASLPLRLATAKLSRKESP